MRRRKKYLINAFIVGLVLLAIDLYVKKLANTHLDLHRRIDTAIPNLDMYLTHNTGYHYIFGKIDNHQLWSLFGLVMGVVLISTFAYSLLKEKTEWFYLKAYAIILALTVGAMGNVLEILFTRKATDFFILQPFPWPSNLCDQYINAIIYIAIPAILIRYIITRAKQKKQDKQAE